jgi:hypothetical protein
MTTRSARALLIKWHGVRCQREKGSRTRPLLLILALLALAAVEPPPKPAPLDPAEASRQGRALAAELISGHPTQNITNSAVLNIRDANGNLAQIPVRFELFLSGNSWENRYVVLNTNSSIITETLSVIHADSQPNRYLHSLAGTTTPAACDPTNSFAGSDFALGDLGLEFLHWPEQRVLKSQMRRSRSCRVLESVNPSPAPGAYSRVVCWVDIDTDGIVHADAYDCKNKLLKEFDPKEFKKVDGQWQLREMEIDNRQTGSRTRIEFNLDPSSGPH